MPIVLFYDTVFYIYSKLGPFSAIDRAASFVQKIELLEGEHLFDENKLVVIESGESHDLVHEGVILVGVTERDTLWRNLSRGQLVEEYSLTMKQSI